MAAGRWARRLLQTAVATGAAAAILPLAVPSAGPQIKRLLVTSGSSEPTDAAGSLSSLQLQPVRGAQRVPDERVGLSTLWGDRTLILHVMRRFG